MYERKQLKHITIIGAGSWGTVIAKVIAENYPNIILKIWAYEKSTANSINIRNQNIDYLPGIKLPVNIKATTNLKDSIENSRAIILATPSKVIPDIVGRLVKKMKYPVPIAYLTKGFCKVNNEILTISQTISRLMPDYKNRVVAIYGPSHAEELVNNYHTCLNIASKSEKDRNLFSELLNCSYLQCRKTDDIIGVDVGGTLKNPAAIAAGIISSLPDCGDNLSGALIAESLKEMIDLGTAIGGKIETIIDISGTGDLVATSLSDHSRNRRFGKNIALQIMDKGIKLRLADKLYLRFKPEFVLEKMSQKVHYLVEGAYAIEPLIELAGNNNVAIPVYRSLYEVLLNKKDPSLLIETIKNPSKFDEIYNDIKIHVKDKQKGLEKVKGRAFKKIITQRILSKYNFNLDKKNNTSEPLFKNLKSLIEVKKNLNYKFFKNEENLINNLNHENYEKIIKRLVRIYLNEIIDLYSPLFYSIFGRYLKLKYLWNKIKRYKNNIISLGNFNELKALKDSVNIIYVARYKNLLDYLYYLFSIKKKGLPSPRFFISDTTITNPLKKYLIKKSGGFFIDKSNLDNILYREGLIQYLSTLISHGVPVLYFSELEPDKKSNIYSLSESFFQLINEVLFQESREIALIPSQITYKNKLDETEKKPPFTEEVMVHFSQSIFLSDFTKQSAALTSISELIQNIWIRDEIVLPQHIMCSLLTKNNFILSNHQLKKNTEKFINENSIVINMNTRQVINRGIKFLIENDIILKKEDNYLGVKKEDIKKLAKIISDKTLCED